MRTPINIEKLLHWTYRDELPKREIGGLTGWETLIYLGTKIDHSRQDWQPGFPVIMGPPHPDALLVDHAVRSLGDTVVEWEHACERIMGPLLPYAPAENKVLRRMEFNGSALVTMHARLGNRPHWQMGELKLLRVLGKNGKPVVNGMTAGRRYAEGSHCPLRLEPKGEDIAQARCEYVAWHGSLVRLCGMLNDTWRLSEWKAELPTASPLPWIHDDEPKRRIIHAHTGD